MSAPSVRLLLKDQLVAEVPFRGPMLRIGRMKENEVVINNLSVSRFHATLSREDGGFVLRDLGSENGCWVNGRRVTEARVGPDDLIQIGKHTLELVAGDAQAAGAEPPPEAPRGRSDAWDAAHTYFVGPETRAKMLGQEAPAPDGDAPLGAPSGADALAGGSRGDSGGELWQGRTASGAELFGQAGDDLAPPDLAEFDVSELEIRDEPPAAPEASAPAAPEEDPGTALFDVDPAEPTSGEPATVAFVPEPESAPAPAPEAGGPLYAGFIVQRAGRLERVVALEGDRMTLGRAADCEVVLALAEVSRRHAMLVRDGDRYELRDLESVNGTFVNGERITRRTLAVGDVIRIEDFELTFVLDREPLGQAVREAPAADVAAENDPRGATVLDLAPFVAEPGPDAPDAISFDAFEPEPPPPPVGASAEPPPPPAADAAPLAFDVDGPSDTLLLDDELDAEDEKPLAPAAADPARGKAVRFELVVRVEELPPPLRSALADLSEADLRLPVELRMARDADGE